MSELIDELRDIASSLREVAVHGEDAQLGAPVEKLENAATTVGQAWSGSSLGYHAYVYFAELDPPPPGAHFSQEWGLMGTFQGSTGNWREHRYQDVYDRILEMAGNPDLGPLQQLADDACRAVSRTRPSIASILETWLTEHPADAFVAKLKERVDGVVVLDAQRATELQIQNGQIMTRDTTATGQGFRAAPHQGIIGLVVGLRSPFSACQELADLAEQAAAHVERTDRRQQRQEAAMSGSFVFIGHGRSALWRELKDFLHDRVGLHCDEFNRVPVAGVTNVERLVQMLDDAAIAFLVLTAEDEKVDGSVVARQNVVHEAGLFQGRLGFTRAIVLLEEGCEEFSNIAGLGQIRFPSGRINACFEEIRRVLEREGLA